MASLSLKNVCKVYPNGFEAVKDFNLEIADQEFIIFVGPSGCGKSTTLRMIAGLEDISSGELKIGDRVVNDVEPKDRDIAMVFQNYALYPHMSVYDNMAFGLKLRKVPKEQIKPVQSEESRMQTLFRAIRIGDSAEIERAAHGEMEKLHKNTETMSQYNLATMEIVSGFFKFCTDNSLDFNKISGNMQNIYEKVSQMDESSLTAWIVQMSETISEKLKCARNSSARRLIVEAQNIVQERYMEADISLDEVCAVLGVSNSYFSSVFKKEAGKSFISYLTDYRMDIAAEMILNTDEKSYTIAEKVGYLDANYFSYVFKKKFGVSPSKYRASVK